MELLSPSSNFLNLRYASSLLSHSAMRSFETGGHQLEFVKGYTGAFRFHTVELASIPSHLLHDVVSKPVYDPRLLSYENVDSSSFYLTQLWDDLKRA